MPEHKSFPDDILIGAAFSNVVIDDNYAFLAGLVAADVNRGLAVVGDVGAETTVVMETVKLLLGKIGLEMSDIVRCDVHLTDMHDIDVMDEAYSCFFEAGHYPARTTTQSGALFGGCKVEVTCQARLDAKRQRRRS